MCIKILLVTGFPELDGAIFSAKCSSFWRQTWRRFSGNISKMSLGVPAKKAVSTSAVAATVRFDSMSPKWSSNESPFLPAAESSA